MTKIVFHVEDDDGRIIVEKSQVQIVFGTDPDTSLTIHELGRDHVKEMKDSFAVRIMPEDSIVRRRRVVEEIMQAHGIIIAKFVRNKLREWARQIETI